VALAISEVRGIVRLLHLPAQRVAADPGCSPVRRHAPGLVGDVEDQADRPAPG
jgi:hypothetical protein